MNVILPVAGESSRYPDMRPKWLLTNPSSNLMIVDSVLGINLEKVENIFLIYLKKHEDEFNFKKGLLKNFNKYNLSKKIKFIELQESTKNQVETIRNGLKFINEDISFLIKDCDNYFSLNFSENKNNFVCYASLNDSHFNVCSKSYIKLDNNKIISNIVEKKVISDKFCCGGYFFKSSEEFIKYSNMQCDDLYVSDVIYNMMINGIKFSGEECFNYLDWGSLENWEKYKEEYKTLFIDIDGVLMYNSSEYVPPFIENTEFIADNINIIKQMVDTGKVEVILTTSRSEIYREITELQMNNIGLKYKYLIMGLQHNKRIIINDFSLTNKYKSCDSINIPRNCNNLKEYLY